MSSGNPEKNSNPRIGANFSLQTLMLLVVYSQVNMYMQLERGIAPVGVFFPRMCDTEGFLIGNPL